MIVKFSDLKIDDEFIYNGLVYTKRYENQAINLRYGFFTINPDEEVEIGRDLSLRGTICKIPVIRFAFIWSVVCAIVYLIGEFCL